MEIMPPDVGAGVNGAADQSPLSAVPRMNLGLALPRVELGLGTANGSSANGHSANGHAPNGDSANGRAYRHTVSVVVPALNEQKNIGWVLDRMPAGIDEVVLVDGYSRDQTVDIARAVRPDIVVIRQNGRGKGEALRTGFRTATGDIIVMIDADGSMDPAEIDRYITPLLNGYDFVKGSRFLTGGGSTDLTPVRRLGSQALVRMTNALFLVRFTDLCYGYCSFRRDCLPALALTAHGFEIETELVVHAVKANLRIAEVASMELPRRSGMSNLHTFRDGQRVLRTLVRERVTRRPRPVVDPIDQRALHDWRTAADFLGARASHEPLISRSR